MINDVCNHDLRAAASCMPRVPAFAHREHYAGDESIVYLAIATHPIYFPLAVPLPFTITNITSILRRQRRHILLSTC